MSFTSLAKAISYLSDINIRVIRPKNINLKLFLSLKRRVETITKVTDATGAINPRKYQRQ
jgi:hypothetical protein